MSPLHIAILAALTAVALLWLGLRGRRVGDHPFCRRCGFDLFGKPAGSHICAECGASLLAPRACVIGVRHRRPWAIACGSIVLLPLCGFAGILAWGTYHGVNWQNYKPVWYLAREASGSDIRTRDAAIGELMVRYSSAKLTKPQVASLLAQALAAQADLSTPWATAWGDLIEAAHTAGDLTPADWKRYAAQVVGGMYVVRYRREVASDTPFGFALDSRGARVGSRATLMHYAHLLGVVVDGVERMNREDPSTFGAPLVATPRPATAYRPIGGAGFTGAIGGVLGSGRAGGAGGAGGVAAGWRLFEALNPGPHDGFVRLDVLIADSSIRGIPTTRSSAGVAPSRPLRPANTITQVELHLPIHLDVVPPGRPLARPFDEPARRDAVAAALHVRYARMMTPTFMQLQVSCDPLPVDLSFKVSIRDGTREWPLGLFACSRSESGIYAARLLLRPVYGILPNIDSPLPLAVDVVFRPDPDAAVLLTPDVTRYWSGEPIVVQGVWLSTGPTTMRTAPLPPARPVSPSPPRLWDGVRWEQRRNLPADRQVTF